MPTHPSKKIDAVSGRLSFHKLTAVEAFEDAQRGPFASSSPSPAESRPYVTLLLRDTQYQRMLAFFKDTFLPYCVAQYKVDTKAPDALSQADVDLLLAALDGPLDATTLNLPFKAVSDKTLELMPDAVAALKVIARKGQDFIVRGKVNNEKELKVVDPDILEFPKYLPIGETVHTLYSGCWAIASGLSVYAYKNGKSPGFSMGGNEVVFTRNDTPFGGGGVVDDDALFLAEQEA